MSTRRRFRGVVIGCSAGGLEALRRVLAPLPPTFNLPVVVVAHTAADSGGLLPSLLDRACALSVVEAEEKMPAQPGRVYVAPPGYHLLIEEDETFSLSVDDKVCNVRPSIDVLFESAADVWGDGLIGVILTGANSDGTAGLKAIKGLGGYGIAEEPKTAYAETMPQSAISAGVVDRVLSLDVIGECLVVLSRPGKGASR